MNARFEGWRSPENDRWYFHLRAANGEIVMVGSETDGYDD
jgi:uncharacterized protein YegP (UPF0339 family)